MKKKVSYYWGIFYIPWTAQILSISFEEFWPVWSSHNERVEHFHHPWNSPCIHFQTVGYPDSHAKQTLFWFLSIQVSLPVLKFIADGIIQYIILYVWLILLSIVLLRFMHVIVCICNNYFFVSLHSILSYRIDHNLFISSPLDGHLSCFQLGAILGGKALTIILVQVIWGNTVL